VLKTLDMRFRWMIPRDYSEVAEIDQQHIWLKWMPEDFKRQNRNRNAISVITEVNGVIVGYCCYRMMGSYLQIDRMAVDRRFHRQGVGRGLLINLMNKLSTQRRDMIVASVRKGWLCKDMYGFWWCNEKPEWAGYGSWHRSDPDSMIEEVHRIITDPWPDHPNGGPECVMEVG